MCIHRRNFNTKVGREENQIEQHLLTIQRIHYRQDFQERDKRRIGRRLSTICQRASGDSLHLRFCRRLFVLGRSPIQGLNLLCFSVRKSGKFILPSALG